VRVRDGDNDNDDVGVGVGVISYDDGDAPHGLIFFRCHSRGNGSRRSCGYCYCCCCCCCCVVILVVVVTGVVSARVASMVVS